MKMRFIILLAAFFLVATTACAGPQAPHDGSMALTLIVDTSWSCEQEISDFRPLGQQGAETLEPGDYLEIIAARGGKPRLMLAQEIETGDADESRKVSAALRAIHSYFLSDANVSAALEMAFKRLTIVCAEKRYGRAAVIIFTDGQIKRTDAARIITLAQKFNANGWPVYLTGNNNTSKSLLIAANNEILHWHKIDESSPQTWLRGLKPDEPVVSTPPPEDPVIGRITDALIPDLFGEPLVQDTLPEDQKDGGYSIKTRIDSTVSIGPRVEPPAQETPLEPPDTDAASPAVEPNEPTDEDVTEDSVVAQQPQPSSPSFWSRLTKLAVNPWSWIITAVALLIGALLLAGHIAVRRAGRMTTTVKGRLATSRREVTGTLVVTVNGQSHPLGPYARFNGIHLGRDTGNTIQLTDKQIEKRHLRLFKKGADLMIHNLSKIPFVADGKTIRPGHKEPLPLPANVQITEKIRMTVAVVRPKTEAAKGGESHGTQ